MIRWISKRAPATERAMPKHWISISAGSLLLACATPRAASPQLLLTRASFDLGCPPASLRIYTFDARTRAIVGCGQRVTYVEDCRASGRPCTWVADVGPTATPWRSAAQQQPTPAAVVPGQPQPVPGNHAFRGEEDYGF